MSTSLLKLCVQSFTSQLIPTMVNMPYETILLILQTRSELVHDHKIDAHMTSFETIKQFLIQEGFFSLWSGYTLKLYANCINKFTSNNIVNFYGLSDIDPNIPLLQRYSRFLMGMLSKTIISWLLGYWIIIGWSWKVTAYTHGKITEKENSKGKTKKTKHNSSPILTSKYASLSNIIKEIKINITLMKFLFICKIASDVCHLTMEFFCDDFFTDAFSTVNPLIRSKLIHSIIIFMCKFATWPIETLMYKVAVGSRYRRNKNFGKLLERINKTLQQEGMLQTLFNGFPLFSMVQLFYLLFNVAMNVLADVNKQRNVR